MNNRARRTTSLARIARSGAPTCRPTRRFNTRTSIPASTSSTTATSASSSTTSSSHRAGLGGIDGDSGPGIAVDANGNAYITGGTASSDVPTPAGAFQPAATGSHAFVTKRNSTGAAVYSTNLGGSGGEGGSAIAVD